MISETYFLFGAASLATLGGANDLRNARIPNRLTYSGLLLALGFRFGLLGWPGLKSGTAGMLIAGIVFFLLFVIGAMGGGDVKLMASVGAWVGSEHVLIMLLAAALAGGVLAIVFVLFRRGLYTAILNVLELIRFRLTSGFNPHPLLNVREVGTLRVPFGVAIAIGTFFCVGNAIWWR